MKHILTILILFIFCSVANAQADEFRLSLDQKIFENQIKNHAWSLEFLNKKDSNEMFLLNFINETINLAYLDWKNGISGIYSKYDIKFSNNFAEIKPKKWKSSKGTIDNYPFPKPFIIYCYLKDEDTIGILLSQRKIGFGEKLKVDGGWEEMELIKN